MADLPTSPMAGFVPVEVTVTHPLDVDSCLLPVVSSHLLPFADVRDHV